MRCDREKLLRKIQEADFAVVESALYLDGHPRNTRALNYYQKYRDLSRQLTEEYEAMYGPLTMRGNYDYTDWQWINNPWPWENSEEGC